MTFGRLRSVCILRILAVQDGPSLLDQEYCDPSKRTELRLAANCYNV